MNTDQSTTDADQLTANTAFVAIDKGLLSGKVSEQVEAIVKFPALFDRHPFPLLINSSMLKLADVFRVGSNFTRLCILRVCQQSERHLDKILNVDEVVRRIFSVTHSNDPVARGLALSTLGSLSAIIPQRKQVHHSIRQALDSRDPAELDAGIVAAQRFAAVSKTFATNISERISEMVEGVATPVDTKLQLLSVLQHMHHDTHTAAAVRQLCVRLLPSFPSEQFVITTLQVLTRLAAKTLVDIPEQVDLLLGYLNNDVRRGVKSAVLRDLLELSRQAAPLWSQENQSSLIAFAASTRYTPVKVAALSVLVELARSVSVSRFDLAPGGPLLRLCRADAYHQDARVAERAVQLLTALAVHCQETGVRPDVPEMAVAACDSLLLLLTSSADPAAGSRPLAGPLRCAVSLARDDATAGLLLESVGGLARAAPPGPARGALLEALCAVGSRRPHVLAPLASDVLAMLEAPDTDGDTSVQLCTLLLQLHVDGSPWPEPEHRALRAAADRVSHWQAYKIARQAMRYGHHAVAAALLRPLLAHVSGEQMHFWLGALLEMSQAEAALVAPPSGELARLSEAAECYARGLASLRATTSPSQLLEFPAEFCRLRWRCLQAHVHLLAACRTLQTSPPPCVAIAGAGGARDDTQRSGRVTAQLQKCAAEFSAVAEEYGRLYRTAFDADPDSLAALERLQRCCLLVAQAVNWAVRRAGPDTVSAAASPGGGGGGGPGAGLEESCRRAAAVVARAHLLSAGGRGLGHHQTAALQAVSRILVTTPLGFPRRFFQTLQKTVISLSVQPQPRASEQVISHPISGQLVVKTDGVVSHGPRGAVFRSIAKVQLSVTAALQGKPPADAKAQDTVISMSRTVEPHNDYFHGQFLLDLRLPGIHLVTVDAHILDADGIQWLTSSSQQLTIRAFDEAQQGRSAHAQAGGSGARAAQH